MSSAVCFSLDKSKILSSGNGLTVSFHNMSCPCGSVSGMQDLTLDQMTKFRPAQNEILGRRQNKCDYKNRTLLRDE